MDKYLENYKQKRISQNLKCGYCGKDASDNERNYIPDSYCPNVVCKEHDHLAWGGRFNKK